MDIKNIVNFATWLVGFASSALIPLKEAPIGLTSPFWLSGAIMGLVGFSVIYVFKGYFKQNRILAAALIFFSAIVGLLLMRSFTRLKNDPDNATPTPDIEFWEWIYFSFAHFCILAVLAMACVFGAKFIVEKLTP